MELIPDFSENRIQIQKLPVPENTTIAESQPIVSKITPEANELTIPVETLLKYFYFVGVLVSLLLFIQNVIRIFLLSRKATVQQMNGYRLLIVGREVPSFAFGRSVIISQTDYDAHGPAILAHEQAHIRQNHFADLLLLELVKTVHWFNPAVYALIGDLKEIHEFQADEQTLHSGIDAKQYQLLIIQKGVGPRRFALANSFNHCQIKKRITMMNKQKTSKAWRWKVATFLPLLALLLMAFGNRSEITFEINSLNDKLSVHPSELVDDVKSLTSEIVPSSSEKIFIQDNRKRKTEPSLPRKDQLIQVDEKTVNGKVVDSEDKPLEGASVVVLGKAIGTVTDKDGVFNLNINDTSSIVVSYVGFKTVKLAPDFEKLMNISLEPGNIGIDKVVAVAYGIQKKQKLTIKGANIEGSSNSGDEKTFTIVEQMPEFPGGALALRKHIAQQIRYPVSAQKAGVAGTVFVHFVINSDGMPSDVKVVRSVEPTLDNEAIRVIYTMPKWKPGFQQGKAVNVAYNLPIEFILQTMTAIDDNTFNASINDVEEVPQFPGGNGALKAFITATMKYPIIALENGIIGQVIVKFVVDKKGSVTNVKILRGVDPSLDKEALRIVNSMPKWNPGKQKGEFVDATYEIPIDFNLPKDYHPVAKEKLRSRYVK
ncbi:MAG: TonB family protein [Prolixibacteraceae bacterium]|nr:TonB family protein [Prolixibacteraceae bacterium]